MQGPACHVRALRTVRRRQSPTWWPGHQVRTASVCPSHSSGTSVVRTTPSRRPWAPPWPSRCCYSRTLCFWSSYGRHWVATHSGSDGSDPDVIAPSVVPVRGPRRRLQSVTDRVGRVDAVKHVTEEVLASNAQCTHVCPVSSRPRRADRDLSASCLHCLCALMSLTIPREPAWKQWR